MPVSLGSAFALVSRRAAAAEGVRESEAMDEEDGEDER